MKKKSLLKMLFVLLAITSVSCERDVIQDEMHETAKSLPFSIKTVTKASLLYSNASSIDVLGEISKLEERSLQKSLDSLYGFKVLTDLVKVIEKPSDSLITYTFPTINFLDNKLKNVVVTEKNGAFATYVVSYETLPNGSTKIEQHLVSNDSSGLAKDFITITYVYCEWLIMQSPRDFQAHGAWECETRSETFFVSSSGNGGGGSNGGGPNGGNTQGGNDGSGNDGSGTWGSSPGGGGGGGGMTIITQPTYANHLTSLKAMSDDPGVKSEIKDWIDNQLAIATAEIGTEWVVGGGLNGTLGKRPAVLIGNVANGVYFGNVVSNGTILRNHLHYNGLAPMFSGMDLLSHLGFFSQNRSGNFITDSSQTTSMVISSFGINPATNKPVAGVYAMRILNSDNAISDLTRLQTPDPLYPQFREIDFVHANLEKSVLKNTEMEFKRLQGLSENMGITEAQYVSSQFISLYESNFIFLLDYYKLSDSIILFKANLDANNNVVSWTKL